jgi:hypothetical protein
MKAKYISIWDDGIEIMSDCKYNIHNNSISNVDSVDVDGMDLGICMDEYVLLSDGTLVRDFFKNPEYEE